MRIDSDRNARLEAEKAQSGEQPLLPFPPEEGEEEGEEEEGEDNEEGEGTMVEPSTLTQPLSERLGESGE